MGDTDSEVAGCQGSNKPGWEVLLELAYVQGVVTATARDWTLFLESLLVNRNVDIPPEERSRLFAVVINAVCASYDFWPQAAIKFFLAQTTLEEFQELLAAVGYFTMEASREGYYYVLRRPRASHR